MFEDYKNEVLEDYKQKRAANQLSLDLINPTPARLRDVCLTVLSTRPDKKDHKIIDHFFDPLKQYNNQEISIRRSDADKFRPLINFLRSRTAFTEDKNIELLAWLINFEKRPYNFESYILGGSPPEDVATTDNDPEPPGTILPPEPPKDTHAFKKLINIISKWKISYAAILAVLFLVGCGATYLLTKEPKFMYWTGTHYEAISSTEDAGGKTIVAFDNSLIRNFRRITNIKEITMKSLGKIWVTPTINGKRDYFTGPGRDPANNNPLKPITHYHILNK